MEWTAKIDTDQIRRSAGLAAQELGEMRSELRKLDVQSTRAERGVDGLGDEMLQTGRQADRMGDEIRGASRDLDHVDDKAGKLGHTLQSDLAKNFGLAEGGGVALAGVLAGAVSAGASKALDMIVSLAEGALELGKRFGEAVIESGDFARAVRSQFSQFGGSAAMGERALQDIRDIARETVTPLEEVRETYATLAAAGMEGDLLRDITRARANFKAMGEESEAAFGKMTDAMVEGEVTISQFEDASKVLGGKEAFGRALGFDSETLANTQAGITKLEARLKQMDPKDFLRVVADRSADMGNLNREAASLKQRFDSFAETTLLDISKDSGITDTFIGLMDAIDEFAASDKGQKALGIMSDALSKLGITLESVTKLGIAFYTGFFGSILGSDMDGAISKGEDLDEALKAIGSAENQERMKKLGEAFSSVIRAILWLLDVSEGARNTFGGIMDDVGGVTERVGALPGELYAAMTDAGSQLMAGLRDGITSAASGPINALQGAVDQLTSIPKFSWGIFSPSRVFGGYAENLMDSMAREFAANDNAKFELERKVESLSGIGSELGNVVRVPMQAAESAPPIQVPGGVSGMTISVGGITVAVPDGSTVDIDSIVRDAEPKLEEMIRNIMARVA